MLLVTTQDDRTLILRPREIYNGIFHDRLLHILEAAAYLSSTKTKFNFTHSVINFSELAPEPPGGGFPPQASSALLSCKTDQTEKQLRN